MTMIHLPSLCGARHPVTDAPILIKRHEAGYRDWPTSKVSPETYNALAGIDDTVVLAMMCGSMSGNWEIDLIEFRRARERAHERKRRDEYRPRKRWDKT